MIKNPFKKTIKHPLEVKENPIGGAFAFGMPMLNGKRKVKEYVEEGYQYNVIVYRAITEVVNGCADICLKVYKNGELVENPKDPIVKLLKKPNPNQGTKEFIKNIFIDYLTTGEIFISKPVLPVNKITELWATSPLGIEVVESDTGIPKAFLYKSGNFKRTFPVDANGKSDMFFQKMYNPTNYWRGMPPLMPAGLSADTHNAGLRWNYSLLKNGARPSGILTFKTQPSGEAQNFVREMFKKQIQGENNAGEIPMLPSEDMEWKEVGTNPKDMDYITTMKEVTKYIASAFGVPLPLIDNDSSSYNNMEQAKERLWTDTILPLYNEFLSAFNDWINMFYNNYELKIDLNTIPALEGVRTRTFERTIKATTAGVYTINEAREALGLEIIDNPVADTPLIPRSVVPLDMADVSINATMKNLGFSDDEIVEIIPIKDKK